MKRKLDRIGCLPGLRLAAVVLLAAVLFAVGIGRLQRGHSQEGRRKLEESLRRSAVACYVIEGIYPPTVAYLEEHYGVQIDRDRYAVFYEVFAENLMPEITVVELK